MSLRPPEAAYLAPNELEAFLAFHVSSHLLTAALDRRLQVEAGIPLTWYVLLAVLSSQPTRTSRQSDLAAIADFSLSRLSYAITKLEQRGWVRRQPHPDDKRATNVMLTDAGAEAIAAAAPDHAAAIKKLFLEPLDERQLRALRDACKAILPGLPGAPLRLIHDDVA